MIFRQRRAGRIRITCISVGVLLLVLTNSGCEPLEDGPPGGSARAAQPGDLGGCPDLSRGRANDVDCVKLLQSALIANGYTGQQVTGYFGDQTKANVVDFQRSHNIHPVSGIVGPLTRAALLGGSTPPTDLSVPPVPASGYSRHSYCEDGACNFYLRRATTRRYAQRLDAHPALGSAVSGALLAGMCGVLRVIKSASVICGLLGGSVADYVGNELQRAARQHACLRLSVGLTSNGTGRRPRLLNATPDNSWRCSD